jgi:hypothetical protein
VTLRFVLNLVSFAQFGANLGNMNHVPGHHGIVQNRKTTEGTEPDRKFPGPVQNRTPRLTSLKKASSVAYLFRAAIE